LPQYSDTGWGANTGNVLTQYLAAIADVTLQLSGGAFTLTAETDFGGNYGLKALYLKTETANPASAGVVRLAKTDSIGWRNNANGADKLLNIDGSDNLQYASTKILLSGAVVNADINAAAAIAYSKLNLTGSIVNADISASAAIAYSKLNLGTSIVNADIATAAAIALTKLAALTNHSRALASDSSGFITESSVTATELGYVSGVTSAIQTQLSGKASTDLSNVASISANVPMNTHKFTGLAAGSGNGDSLRYEQVIGAYLLLTGGTMSGAIAMGSNKVTGLANGSTSGDAIAWGQSFTSGAITFSPTTTGIVGTTTNDSAASGKVGEYISASATNVSTSASATYTNIASVSLTAGDWDVSGVCDNYANTATVSGISAMALSAFSGNTTTDHVNGDNQIFIVAPAAGNDTSGCIPTWRVSLASTTTIYVKGYATYSAGQAKLFGRISARRVR
jgi:hypothetical protein